ncbi:hypothetical protein MUN78_10870 [Leucobacter allii]|uniref:Maltokinase N-terminal cap domain-containing protein n=1 Tax=Leucobacter allii TaxID=2932247 RepID=A0ABY4FJP2_9MICO|nr:hypothetical protein [Leucobacter allii]UOQ56192.1 hypothetical protein MUN78_10870 [Leucobacter allii]
MSIIHRTTLTPSKYELLAAWLPAQPWFSGDPARLEAIGAYRFDDPEGAVGIEGHLCTAGDDTVYHVPLSYRGAPLEAGEEFLVGTMEHGVLGTRWASDAIGDPVFRAVLASTIAHGGTGSREFVQDAEGAESERDPSVRVAGTGVAAAEVPELWAVEVQQRGTSTVAESEFAALAVLRVVDRAADGADDPVGTQSLRGAWGDRIGALLATLTV